MFEGKNGPGVSGFEYWIEVFANNKGQYEAVAHELIAHTQITGVDSFHYEVRCRLSAPQRSEEMAFQKTVNQLAAMLESVGVEVFEAKRERRGEP